MAASWWHATVLVGVAEAVTPGVFRPGEVQGLRHGLLLASCGPGGMHSEDREGDALGRESLARKRAKPARNCAALARSRAVPAPRTVRAAEMTRQRVIERSFGKSRSVLARKVASSAPSPADSSRSAAIATPNSGVNG